jgi:PAS domain S-box-containing protein
MAISEKEVFLKISQATSRISNLEKLLKTSVKISAQALGVDRCSIWLTDDEKKYATVKAVYVKGRSPSVHLGARVELSKFPRFKRIISQEKVVHSPALSKVVANRTEKKFFAKAKIKSFLSVPLKIKNEVFGAFNVGTLKKYKAFNPSEIRLCQIIANQIAGGIENARLYKDLEDEVLKLQEKSIKAHRESEEKYRTLLENLPQLIFLKNKNSVYISANENYCRSLGIKPEEIRGRTDFDFFPKKLAQKYRKDDREIIKTGSTKEIIEDYIEKGARKIVQTVKTPVLGDDGKPIGVLGIFWDITARKRAEDMLKEKEEQFRSLIENASDIVAILDKDLTIRYQSPTIKRILGYQPEELINKKASDYVHPQDLPEAIKAFKKLIKNPKTVQTMEFRVRHKNGSWRTVEAMGKNLLDNPGVMGVVINYHDITDRKQAEDALRESEEKWRSLVKNAPNIIIVVNRDGTIQFINRTVPPLTIEESTGKSIYHYIEPEYHQAVKKTIKHVFQTGKLGSYQIKGVGSDGSVAWYETQAGPIMGDGQIIAVTLITTDITERKSLERALIQKEKIARERARLLTDLRSLDGIDEILTRVCQAVRDSSLFERAVMSINKSGGEIVNLGQAGLPSDMVRQARRAPPIDPKLRARITGKRFRISDSFFVPVEAGVDFTKSGRYIPQKRRRSVGGDWQPGDELFVPLRDFSGKIMGYLSVDTPVDGNRPDVKIIEALEMLVEAAASRIREVEAQKALKMERDFSRSIVDTANSLIVCLDADARIKIFNDECELVTGYKREEVLGKRWPELFLPSEHRHPKLKSFVEWVKTHPKDQYEGPIKTKKGEIRTILWSNTAILGSGKSDLIAIAIGQDITERKKTEKALQLSQERYQLATKAAKVGVWDWDLKSNKFYIDPNVKAILGYKDKEIPNDIEVWTTYVHPDDLKPVMAAAQACIDGRTPEYVFEHRMMHKDGSIRWILSCGKVIRDKEGDAVRMIGTDTDVTERKKADEAIRESEEKFRNLFENATDAIFIADPKMGLIIDANKKAEKLLNRPREEIIGLHQSKLHPPDKEKYHKNKFRKHVEEGSTIDFEAEIIKKNGTLVPVYISTAVINIAGKKVIQGIFRDISELKKAETAMKESQNFLEEIIDHIPDPIFIKNRKHQWILLNKALSEMVGYPREEMLGKSDYDYFPKKQADFFWKKDEQMFRTGKIVDIPEEPITDAKGNTHWLHTKKAPLRDSLGKINTLVGIIRDITDQKKAVEALRKSKDLNTILQISYRITQILDLDKMLKLACQETAKALDVDKCTAILFDEKEKEGTVRGMYEKNRPHPPGLRQKHLLKDYPMLLKHYRQKKRFLNVPVVEKAPLSRKEKDSIKNTKVKSFVIVPIDSGKKLLGSFSVATVEKERVFTNSEITFVQTLTNHLAIAVENARLMELVKEQTENLRILSQRVITAQEKERRRIAQELHDEIGQTLTVMKINMEMSKQKIPSEFTQVIDRIRDNEDLVSQTLDKVRNLTTDLSPPMLDDFGLIPTLKWYIDSFSKRTNIKITLQSDDCRGRFPFDVEMVLYRIAQEALTNVAKHARATQVLIALEKKNNYAILSVRDNGIGFDIKKVLSEHKGKKGFGLFNIKERVKLLNGNFSITSKPKKGTRLQVRIPCPGG